MKSNNRKKTDKLSSGPPVARDHDAGLLDGRTVNTLRIDDGDEPTADLQGGDWPTLPADLLVIDILHVRLGAFRRDGDGVYRTRCPACIDGRVSLDDTDSHNLPLSCTAGCSPNCICAAVGLSATQLYAQAESEKPPAGTDPAAAFDPDAPPDPKFQSYLDRVQAHPERERQLARLADLLGLPARVLHGFGIVWSDSHNEWCVPERDHLGRVVGVFSWHDSGFLSHLTGSKRGLFLPERPAEDGTLYVCEGLSDTATMLAAGRRAIGRSGGRLPPLVNAWVIKEVAAARRRRRRGDRVDTARAWLAKYLKEVPANTRVVVVGYRDDAGRDDASSLSAWLADECGRPVRWALPRAGFKDVREQWLATGSDGLELQTGTGR